VTAAAHPGWIAAAGPPAVAAPLRAVDAWHAEQADGVLLVTARAGVRGDDPNLRGHFPGLAIFPGVFIIEALAQAVTLAIEAGQAGPAVLRGVRSARFLAPALDGDELTLRIAVTPDGSGGWSAAARVWLGDGTVCARLRASFGPGGAGDA
jgi:3-hydroxyacyl-[acyl-carrier-protein] dehydratase